MKMCFVYLVGFMGYAVVSQHGRGLLQRMRSRAFIIGDVNKTENRVVYVSVDNGMAFQIVKSEVADRLNKSFGSNLYNDKNVIISGTHTHSTPGGTGGTALVDITTLGFVKQNWEACVDGIIQSIKRAHNNLQLGRIKMNIGQVDNANINRSPASYLNNIDKGEYSANTDHEMTVLRFESIDGKKEIGMINFYPVHAVCLNNTNKLVAGDHKGYASYLFEKNKNPPGTLPGQGQFVAAFGQSNEGDVSPNLMGPKCLDTGLPCDFATSTCNGRTEKCIAFGPGENMYQSNQIIGTREYHTAKDLYEKAEIFLNGDTTVDFRHTYVDMQVSSNFTNYQLIFEEINLFICLENKC
jgi:neutral ceramidase